MLHVTPRLASLVARYVQHKGDLYTANYGTNNNGCIYRRPSNNRDEFVHNSSFRFSAQATRANIL